MSKNLYARTLEIVELDKKRKQIDWMINNDEGEPIMGIDGSDILVALWDYGDATIDADPNDINFMAAAPKMAKLIVDYQTTVDDCESALNRTKTTLLYIIDFLNMEPMDWIRAKAFATVRLEDINKTLKELRE